MWIYIEKDSIKINFKHGAFLLDVYLLHSVHFQSTNEFNMWFLDLLLGLKIKQCYLNIACWWIIFIIWRVPFPTFTKLKKKKKIQGVSIFRKPFLNSKLQPISTSFKKEISIVSHTAKKINFRKTASPKKLLPLKFVS